MSREFNLMANNIGGRIKTARKKVGITQGELAKRVGVSLQTLNKYERGHRTPDAGLLGMVAKELCCDPGWLLSGEDRTYAPPEPSGEKFILAEDMLDWETLRKTTSVAGGSPDELVSINIYSLGILRDLKDKSLRTPLGAVFMPKKYASIGPVAFKMHGEGMSPTIKDGAILGVDYKTKDIIEGKAYVVKLPDGDAAVRRLVRGIGKIILKPDNPIFPEMSIDALLFKEKGLIAGRVAWVVQELD